MQIFVESAESAESAKQNWKIRKRKETCSFSSQKRNKLSKKGTSETIQVQYKYNTSTIQDRGSKKD